MKVQRRERDGVVVLDLSGKILGGNDSEDLKNEIDRAIDEGIPSLLINLGGVAWMNSSGLGILLSGFLRLKEKGGATKFLRVQPRVKEILVTTKLIQVLEVFDDEEEAIRSFAEGGSRSVPRP
ncbi:MAG: STAS domain-containing protein [Candidatus Eisenbacteria bacterium]|nr:STAS domain-containing protein [Candidatus Eisenbacteria bacterium]